MKKKRSGRSNCPYPQPGRVLKRMKTKGNREKAWMALAFLAGMASVLALVAGISLSAAAPQVPGGGDEAPVILTIEGYLA